MATSPGPGDHPQTTLLTQAHLVCVCVPIKLYLQNKRWARCSHRRSLQTPPCRLSGLYLGIHSPPPPIIPDAASQMADSSFCLWAVLFHFLPPAYSGVHFLAWALGLLHLKQAYFLSQGIRSGCFFPPEVFWVT